MQERSPVPDGFRVAALDLDGIRIVRARFLNVRLDRAVFQFALSGLGGGGHRLGFSDRITRPKDQVFSTCVLTHVFCTSGYNLISRRKPSNWCPTAEFDR